MSWIIVVLRSLVTWSAGVLATIILAPVVIVVALFNDTSPWIDKVIRLWSRTWLIASRSPLTVEGGEHIDPRRSYVVVSNHISTLDIMICLLAAPIPIRFLAKKELFRVPLLAQGMRAVGVIEVDRSARRAAHAGVNKQAKALIDKKRSLIIYAEGTRPRDGVMKSFKKGAFTMAIAAQLPVLPMTIHGAFESMPPGKPWVFGGPVKAVVDPPIETTGMDGSGTSALRDQVFDIISTRVREMGGRVGPAA